MKSVDLLCSRVNQAVSFIKCFLVKRNLFESVVVLATSFTLSHFYQIFNSTNFGKINQFTLCVQFLRATYLLLPFFNFFSETSLLKILSSKLCSSFKKTSPPHPPIQPHPFLQKIPQKNILAIHDRLFTSRAYQ